jgi:hypothetical protein
MKDLIPFIGAWFTLHGTNNSYRIEIRMIFFNLVLYHIGGWVVFLFPCNEEHFTIKHDKINTFSAIKASSGVYVSCINFDEIY